MGVDKEAKRGERTRKSIGINKKTVSSYGGECNTITMTTQKCFSSDTLRLFASLQMFHNQM